MGGGSTVARYLSSPAESFRVCFFFLSRIWIFVAVTAEANEHRETLVDGKGVRGGKLDSCRPGAPKESSDSVMCSPPGECWQRQHWLPWNHTRRRSVPGASNFTEAGARGKESGFGGSDTRLNPPLVRNSLTSTAGPMGGVKKDKTLLMDQDSGEGH
ncbi:hypothetical protein NDU88_003534 [Pleurodeles waltl]|uniref:Uncharacterized protein n=1 Tax=Pleurodeles waltl TaxID=8319 RepID=A0AAV7PCC7_PLEWA|nr:hypothetical protein NDU88_003534 [Pleurodeles waltl]